MRQTINHLVPSFGTLKLILFLLMSPNTLSNMEKEGNVKHFTHTHTRNPPGISHPRLLEMSLTWVHWKDS